MGYNITEARARFRKDLTTDRTKVLKKLVFEMLKRAETYVSRCQYDWVNKDGTLHGDNNPQCHSGLSNVRPGAIYVCNITQYKDNVEAGRAFVEFVTGPDSPYIQSKDLLFPSEPLEVEVDGAVYDVNSLKFRQDVGFVFLRPGKTPLFPAMNLMKMTRMIYEYPEVVTLWHDFVKAGANPRAAVVAASCLQVSSLSGSVYHSPVGHSWLQYGGWIESTLRNVLHQRYNTIGEKFLDSGGNFDRVDDVFAETKYKKNNYGEYMVNSNEKDPIKEWISRIPIKQETYYDPFSRKHVPVKEQLLSREDVVKYLPAIIEKECK